MTYRSTTLSALAIVAAAPAMAECTSVTFADVGWTDITATTATTTVVLEAMGYDTETRLLSVPVTYTSLAAGDIDVFLGNWMPTMEADIAPTARKAASKSCAPTSKGPSTRWPPTPSARKWASPISPISRTMPSRWKKPSTASSRAMTATA